MIADFLDLEQHLKRRFREDSITDILIASLLSLPGNDVVVLTPPETKTGGDFDLIVVQPSTNEAVQFRIQAKRLTPHKQNWETGSYVELAHPHNTGAQSRTLLRSIGREAIPTIPLYAFYNPAHVCAASGSRVSGIELASGRTVRECIKAIVKAKPKRLPYKRIGSLQPFFFPLSRILCPPRRHSSAEKIPLPAESRASVEEAINERRAATGYFQTPQLPSERQMLFISDENPDESSEKRGRSQPKKATPDIDGRRLPEIVRTAIERREDRIITTNVRRPRILLISEVREK